MKQNDSKYVTDRKIGYDYLRILAVFAVIILHVVASNWYLVDWNSTEWMSFVIFDGLVRWAVPAFVMISGAMLLAREIPVKTIYTKYILRMVIVFLAWSTFYAIMDYRNGQSLPNAALNVVTGHYHMWFIWMIIGLYACIPLLQAIARREQLRKYFLLLSFCFAFVIPQCLSVIRDFGPGGLSKVVQAIRVDLNSLDLSMVMGYSFYFVLGYYMDSIEISSKNRRILYCLGGLGVVMTILLNWGVSVRTGGPNSYYSSSFTVNVFLESLALFVLFKYCRCRAGLKRTLVVRLSKYSFGVYLVHAYIMELLIQWGMTSVMWNSFIAVPVMGIVIFLLSYIISWVLHMIPGIRKYLV